MPSQETLTRAEEISARWREKVLERQSAALLTSDPIEVEMPSGDSVLAIRANLLSLLEAGRIPDGLTPFVTDLMRSEPGDIVKTITTKIETNWSEYLRMLDNVWIACVVAPRTSFARIPADGEVSITLIELDDKIALFNWAQGVSDHLAAFRDAKSGALRAVDDQPGDPEVHTSGAPGDSPLREPLAVVADQPSDPDVRAMGGQPSRGNNRGSRRSAKERQADKVDS